MAQVLSADKIQNLTQALGVVTLPSGSILTIGGQQYTTSTNISVTPTSLSANTLYFVYAYISGGNVTLTWSTNVNSVGPVGATSWKLVGAFMSNGLASVAFGSFVNIVGVPETDWISYLPSTSNWTNTIPTGVYRITGRTCQYEINIAFSGTPVASGILTISGPFTHDSSRIAASAFGDETSGVCSFINFGIEEWEGNITPVGAGGFEPRIQRTSSATVGSAIDQTLQFGANPPTGTGIGTITSNWAIQMRTMPIPTTGGTIFTLNELRSL